MPTALSRVFARYDVLETSYHFFSEKIDLHFCDDPGDGRSVHPDLKEGGALQVTLSQLQVDYYPYHWSGPEGNTRKLWIRYEEGPVSRWVRHISKKIESLKEKFKENDVSLSKESKSSR